MGNLAGLMSAASRCSAGVKSLVERYPGTSSGAVSLVVCCWEDQELATALEWVEQASLHLQPAVRHSWQHQGKTSLHPFTDRRKHQCVHAGVCVCVCVQSCFPQMPGASDCAALNEAVGRQGWKERSYNSFGVQLNQSRM